MIPFNADDLHLLHQTFTNPFVRKYLWDNEIVSTEQTKEILLINEQRFNSVNWGLWKIIIKSDHAYVGFVGLWTFFNEGQPQLLYGLLPDRTGFGYATEASRVIIDYAFNKLKFNYLVAACDTPNESSKKVCERLEMEMIEEMQMNGKLTTFYRLNK